MVVCVATLQQFSELENCFIDGTPLKLGEQQMSRKDVVVSGWDTISNECGSVHDTISESVDSETLRRRKTAARKLASHSRWTGYSPDECYSPAFANEVVNEYLDDTKWRGLPIETPSAEEKVAEWMSYGKSQPSSMVGYGTSSNSPSPIFGHVQDRRLRGRRSRSVILRFEAEQRQQSESQQPSIFQPTSAQTARSGTEDSRTKRRKNMDTTSRNVGVEKPLPELPRKESLKKYSGAGSRNTRNEVQQSSHTRQRAEGAAAHELQPEQQHSPPIHRKTRPDISAHSPVREQERPMMPKRVSKSKSTKSLSKNVIKALPPKPKPPQLVTAVNRQKAEQAQRHTMPESQTSRDEALRKLENVDNRTSQPGRAKSENIDIEGMRKTLGLATVNQINAKAPSEYIETIFRKPVSDSRRQRPRPAPIDMGAVLEANKNHLEQQTTTFSELKREKLSEPCNASEEVLYSEHPSALIPRPLSLPFKKSATSDIQMMSPIEKLESSHDRFKRHRRFFDNRPLGKCLYGDGVDDVSEGLYNRLIEETKLYEAHRSVQQYKQKAFWDNLRLELNTEDDDDKVEEEN